MGRCAIQVVMGPAGSGKSTYCQVMQEHGTATATTRRKVYVANLDPAAEVFAYEPCFDVRELISVREVMEELGLGPNGALLYCMEYLLENTDWLRDNLDNFDDDEDYLLLDCPGQIELYTHVPVMRRILQSMKTWGYDESTTVSVFCVDVAFCVDVDKFLSGALLSLSAMIALELPHVNVLTKCDLMPESDIERILSRQSAIELCHLEHDRYTLLPEPATLAAAAEAAAATTRTASASDEQEDGKKEKQRLEILEDRRRKRRALTDAIGQLLDDYSMVSFVPLNINDEDSVDHVMAVVDHTIQYGENLEVRGAERDDDDDDGNEGGGGGFGEIGGGGYGDDDGGVDFRHYLGGGSTEE